MEAKSRMTRAGLIAALTQALEALPEEELDQLLEEEAARHADNEVRYGKNKSDSLGHPWIDLRIYEKGEGVCDLYVNVFPFCSGWEFKVSVGRGGVQGVESRTERSRGTW